MYQAVLMSMKKGSFDPFSSLYNDDRWRKETFSMWIYVLEGYWNVVWRYDSPRQYIYIEGNRNATQH